MVIEARYRETDTERILEFRENNDTVRITAKTKGYGMLRVETPAGEQERYYALDMALDHAAEILDEHPNNLEVPSKARDMGI